MKRNSRRAIWRTRVPFILYLCLDRILGYVVFYSKPEINLNPVYSTKRPDFRLFPYFPRILHSESYGHTGRAHRTGTDIDRGGGEQTIEVRKWYNFGASWYFGNLSTELENCVIAIGIHPGSHIPKIINYKFLFQHITNKTRTAVLSYWIPEIQLYLFWWHDQILYLHIFQVTNSKHVCTS